MKILVFLAGSRTARVWHSSSGYAFRFALCVSVKFSETGMLTVRFQFARKVPAVPVLLSVGGETAWAIAI